MKRWVGFGSAVAVAGIAAMALTSVKPGPDRAVAQDAAIPEDELPRFTPEGELIRPESWEAWVMVGASLGLSYSEDSFEPVPSEDGGPGSFHNIYMQPWAYHQFWETGEFPEGTMLILAMYSPSKNADPARGGWYEEGPGFLAEIHLKREGLHESGWGFYGYGRDSKSAAMIPGEAACYSCHARETVYDHVFVQFYPALVERLSGSEEHGGD